MALVQARARNLVLVRDQAPQRSQNPEQIPFVASFHPSDPHQAVVGFVLFEPWVAA